MISVCIFFFTFSGCCLSFVCWFIWCCFSNCFIQFLCGFFQCQIGRGMIYWFISKFCQIYFDICCYNYQICCGYFFGSDCIICVNRIMGFNFYLLVMFFCFGFNGFSCYKGVCYVSWVSSYCNYVFWIVGGNWCCCSDWCSVRFCMVFGFIQEQFRVCNCLGNIIQLDIFIVQCVVIWDGIIENNCYFSVVWIVDDFQFCFLCCCVQQGFCYIGVCLIEISVNNQQCFYYVFFVVS